MEWVGFDAACRSGNPVLLYSYLKECFELKLTVDYKSIYNEILDSRVKAGNSEKDSTHSLENVSLDEFQVVILYNEILSSRSFSEEA